MNHFYSDIIQFKGNHYDFGYMQGELLKESPILSNREKQLTSMRKRHFNINEKEAIHLFSKFIPSMLDELHGLADALNWTMEDALRDFGGYYVEYEKSGCSILTGSEFLIRNYDSHPGYYEGRYTIYNPTDTGYAVIGPSMQITGRTDGMNEKGLAMGYNFINRVGSENGFVCNMIGRIILETCANVDEAISLLKEIPHRTSFSYVLLDPNGETFVVEASPRKVEARKSNISTNHFEVLTEENRYRMDDSLRREKELEGKQSDDLDAYEAYQILNDKEKDIFSNKYDASAGTIHTSAYIPRERKALFAIGGNRMPVIFDFNRYLEGEKINIKQVKGTLNYHTPFVNMDYD
ncbi:C45 family autoproteolytic acyltransferase/hydolase [Lederbergia lenta]|uniref:Peptidase C45 acyl-coenzyme A:6-aminopenicillanic acid acyl-transferase n=1 Tax=Lederbergia lenta TaxID=1467 RepID=A0A2X4VWU7_LEDLE|nr:C45 family peptidase [Lederbergia lenta]MEC2324987.1 C45 family autoproteolytic acyltransferase/hydrolase [Lederbergia lenta]SQI56516.1 peptidase C45 acyl-coenzyme A:6-aminopenicillanic acid acyl-transferase [Lederbergia lenta]